MHFYRIRNSIDAKEIGHYPQIKDVIHNGVAFGNSKFLGEIYFSKIEFEPEVSIPVLYKKSKLTDLIEQVSTIPYNLLVSSKLKAIIKVYCDKNVQFFKSCVFRDGTEYPNYWYMNVYVNSNEYIDYRNSSVIHRKKKTGEYGTIPLILNFDNESSFLSQKNIAIANIEAFYIEKLQLTNVKEDFFMLRDVEGGAGFFVSEKLRKEIEDAGCTGIEFQPSELSYNEWVAPGGERERVYGKSW